MILRSYIVTILIPVLQTENWSAEKLQRQRVTCKYRGITHAHTHTLTDAHPGTCGYTVTGTSGAFFQRKPRAMDTQTDTDILIPAYRKPKCKDHSENSDSRVHTQAIWLRSLLHCTVKNENPLSLLSPSLCQHFCVRLDQ